MNTPCPRSVICVCVKNRKHDAEKLSAVLYPDQSNDSGPCSNQVEFSSAVQPMYLIHFARGDNRSRIVLLYCAWYAWKLLYNIQELR